MMDEAWGSSSTLLPFVSKTYEMVDDPSTNSIVSWSASNRSFVIWDHPKFSRVLLRKFFKHDNFSSFIRQLNAYGFRKVDPNQWEFANDDFLRGQTHLLKNIKRRKPIHSHSLQNLQRQGATPPTDSERQSLKDEIEKLKHDKEQLLMELQRHEDERKMYEKQMHCSNDHLEKLEKKQQDMLSHVLQKHGIALNLSPLTENMDRKRRLPRSGHSSDEAKQNAKSTPIFSIIMERMDQLESSIEFWENIAADIGDALVQGHSNLDFDKSINYAENPAISSVLLDVEVQPKPCGSDMISEPAVAAVPDLSVSTDQSMGTIHVPIGDNDLFWEHFFDIEPRFVRNSGSTIREKGLRWQKE